ncbi:MAG: hypothetical protein R3F43_31080 [bacterium]
MAAALTLGPRWRRWRPPCWPCSTPATAPALVAGLHACVEPHLPRAASIDP